jgi:hypothetical protein
LQSTFAFLFFCFYAPLISPLSSARRTRFRASAFSSLLPSSGAYSLKRTHNCIELRCLSLSIVANT